MSFSDIDLTRLLAALAALAVLLLMFAAGAEMRRLLQRSAVRTGSLIAGVGMGGEVCDRVGPCRGVGHQGAGRGSPDRSIEYIA